MSIWVPLFTNQSMLGAIVTQIFRELQKVLKDFASDFSQIFIKSKQPVFKCWQEGLCVTSLCSWKTTFIPRCLFLVTAT